MMYYSCSQGHDIGTPTAIDSCPACDRFGSPCTGVLKRYGPGSRKTVQRVEADR